MSSLKLFLTCLIAVLLVIGTMFIGYTLFSKQDDISDISNTLNIINVMFTGLAFSAAGIAVYFQSIQLRETKKGLEESGAVQVKTLENQAKMLEIQRLQSEALIKSKQVEITAILKNSDYSYGISNEFEQEINEIIDKINQTGKST